MEKLFSEQPQNQEINSKSNSDDSSPSHFPLSAFSASRKELITPIELTVRDRNGNLTTLPNDLYGHLFLIAPCGSPQSLPLEGNNQVIKTNKDGRTPVYNGDGMVYRLSFNHDRATLKSCFIKPPCYYADLATSDETKKHDYQELAFENIAIARMSLNKLGIRNQLNTAFVPFKLPNDQSDRLLVTWDVGRPYEIDPKTLATLTPVGNNRDWENLLPEQLPQPFKQIMTSAHPVFDFETGELFTVNVGKSIWTVLAFSRSLKSRMVESAKTIKYVVANPDLLPKIQIKFVKLYSIFLGIVRLIIGFLGILEKISKTSSGGYDYDFVHLLAWDGDRVGIKGKWNIVLPGKRALKVDQTIHQMGLTEDYIVFAETSFKFSLTNVLAYQEDLLPKAVKLILSDFADYPQYPVSKLYIVKRKDLKQSAAKANWFLAKLSRNAFQHLPQVIAQEVEIAPEFSHYLVDYENPNNQITIYASHLAATDIAEYIRISDRSAFDSRNGSKEEIAEIAHRMQQLAGNVVSPLDVGRIGRWVINGETGKIVSHQLESDVELTWNTAFYAASNCRNTKKHTDIFWNSWGSWSDTMTKKAVADYGQYVYRQVPVDEVLERTYKGIPASLCHLKIRTDNDNQTSIEIDSENYFQFDKNFLGTSAQFVPSRDAKDETDGYIVCLVLTSDKLLSQPENDNNHSEWSKNTEIWIFKARELNQGPLYKLSHSLLNIGFSFHTSWIAEAKSPDRKLDYDMREDYEYLVQQLIENESNLGKKIRKLFDREIYPHF